MRLTEAGLRRVVRRLLREADAHRCLDGRQVAWGSEACIADLDARIADAVATRDGCPGRTDKRVAYNSLLQMLRRERRAAAKEHRRLHPE